MPAGVEDRDADIWEALLAVADVAGGTWSTRGRDAAVALVTEGKASSPSLGVRLLSDVRMAFVDADKMSTEDILTKLHALDDAPWGDHRGKPLTNLELSRLLNPYAIKPKLLRFGADVIRGYVRADFNDAWHRYLLPVVAKAVTSVTGVARDERRGESRAEAGNPLLAVERA